MFFSIKIKKTYLKLIDFILDTDTDTDTEGTTWPLDLICTSNKLTKLEPKRKQDKHIMRPPTETDIPECCLYLNINSRIVLWHFADYSETFRLIYRYGLSPIPYVSDPAQHLVIYQYRCFPQLLFMSFCSIKSVI